MIQLAGDIKNVYIGNTECKVYLGETKVFPIESTPKDVVDLGLPSGTLWSKYNLGAKEEADIGLYFQWGNTDGYTSPYDENMPNFNDTTGAYLIKNNIDPSTDLTYDAAHKFYDTVQQLDSNINKYRTPTKADCDELLNNCNYELTTEQNSDGIESLGIRFISKINGNSIFISIAKVDGSNWNYGYLTFTSSLYDALISVSVPSQSYAYNIYWEAREGDSVGIITTDNYRNIGNKFGLPIRPVYKP